MKRMIENERIDYVKDVQKHIEIIRKDKYSWNDVINVKAAIQNYDHYNGSPILHPLAERDLVVDITDSNTELLKEYFEYESYHHRIWCKRPDLFINVKCDYEEFCVQLDIGDAKNIGFIGYFDVDQRLLQLDSRKDYYVQLREMFGLPSATQWRIGQPHISWYPDFAILIEDVQFDPGTATMNFMTHDNRYKVAQYNN